MARIIVKGPGLAEAEIVADEDGNPTVYCSCGLAWLVTGSLEEGLQSADTHVDFNCPKRNESEAR